LKPQFLGQLEDTGWGGPEPTATSAVSRGVLSSDKRETVSEIHDSDEDAERGGLMSGGRDLLQDQ